MNRQLESSRGQAGRRCEPNKNRFLRLVIVIRPLRPIKRKQNKMDQLNLGKIPLGQRCPVDFAPNEDVDVKPDGNFIQADVTDGDSTVKIAPGGTPRLSRVFFNGDGAIGQKSAKVAMDGHVGDGDVEIIQVVTWEVVSPDATSFTDAVQPLEPIPAAA